MLNLSNYIGKLFIDKYIIRQKHFDKKKKDGMSMNAFGKLALYPCLYSMLTQGNKKVNIFFEI